MKQFAKSSSPIRRILDRSDPRLRNFDDWLSSRSSDAKLSHFSLSNIIEIFQECFQLRLINTSMMNSVILYHFDSPGWISRRLPFNVWHLLEDYVASNFNFYFLQKSTHGISLIARNISHLATVVEFSFSDIRIEIENLTVKLSKVIYVRLVSDPDFVRRFFI